ncbi:MAG: TonB-dependent receptor plug domain-containing protein [Gammaproteobacteria bacterium]|nr:TonB-dependent receptor plug domain-containing protein [Gammaproteobacteria bacterium]
MLIPRFAGRTPVAGAIALLLQGAPAAAQAPAIGGVTAEQLEEIVVQGRSLDTSLPIELSRYGADVEFVTEQEIENHGFVDVSQSLEMLVPGLYLTTQAGAFSYVDLSLHGSRTSDVLWTVDGVRINNRLYNGTSPADTLPAGMIERTEVLKGGHGLLYGTQAVAGVINVVTRQFSETTEGALSVGADGNDGTHVDGYVSGSIGEHKLVAWASQNETDGYEIYDRYQPSATLRNRGYDVTSFGTKYGYDFSDALQLTVQAVHTDAALDYPTPAGKDVNDRDEDIISARLDYIPDETLRLFVKSYLHDWDTHYYAPPKPADPPYWGYDDFGFTAGAEISPATGPLAYHVGFDFQKYDGVDEVLQIAGQQEQVRALYGQIRTSDSFSEQTRLAAGMRYNETGETSATVGSISAEHHFSDRLYIEGVLGTSFMLPDAFSLYNVDVCCAYGNPALEAEESVSLNLAVGGRLDVGGRPLSWQITGWDRSVDNLISSTTVEQSPIPVPPGYDRVRINVGDEVEVQGAEFLLRGPFTESLSFTFNMSYSKETDTGTGEQLPGRPRRNQKAMLSYDPEGARFGLSFALKHVGETTTDVTGFADQQYGDYYVANIGARVFLDDERRHRVNVRLENAFDEDYAVRVRSAVLETSPAGERYLYRQLGSPRTAFVTYSYTF